MSPSASIRRILAVARTTLRDLGAGCGGVLLVLALVAGLLSAGEARGVEDAESAALAVLDRLQKLVAWTTIAAVILGAWSVDGDRRRGRWSWWASSPLRAWEYALGKWLAVMGGCVLAVPLLLVGMLGLSDEDQRAWLSPLHRQPPSALLTGMRGDDEALPQPLAPVVLSETRARAIFRFDALPRAGAQVLELRCEPWNFERRDDEGHTMVRVLDGRGRQLAEAPLRDSRGPIQLALGEDPTLPLYVRVKPGSFQRPVPLRPGGLRIRPEHVVLLGKEVPAWRTLGRLTGGWLLMLGVGCALALAAAVALADVLASAWALGWIGLGFHRGFLREVSESIASERSTASELGRAVAGGVHELLAVVPEFERWLDLRARVSGVPVEAALDLPLLTAGGWIAAALAWSWGVLKLRRRGW